MCASYACACHVSVFPALQVERNCHIYPQTACNYVTVPVRGDLFVCARLQGRENIGICSEAID